MNARARILSLEDDDVLHMPAEWEPHEATWLSWPHNPTDWPGKLGVMHSVYANLVQKLAFSETVRIVVRSATHEKESRI